MRREHVREMSMPIRVSLVQRIVLSAILALGLLGFYSASDSAGQEKATPPNHEPQQPLVIDVKERSPERFRELFPSWPDDTVLESDGKRITVGEVRARSEQRHVRNAINRYKRLLPSWSGLGRHSVRKRRQGLTPETRKPWHSSSACLSRRRSCKLNCNLSGGSS